MNTTYHKQIATLRKNKEISQTEMASLLGMSRPSYSAVEQGKRELTLGGVETLSLHFGITIDELLGTPSPDYRKYKEMLLAFLREAKASKKVLKKTKLAKLLYLADFAWFYNNLESMSGMPYRKIEFGPVPDAYFATLEELDDDGSIRVKHKQCDNKEMYEITESRESERSIISKLTKDELALIKKIWKNWEDATTREIVKFTHNQLPYKIAFEGELIPYELITQEEADHVF